MIVSLYFHKKVESEKEDGEEKSIFPSLFNGCQTIVELTKFEIYKIWLSFFFYGYHVILGLIKYGRVNKFN